MDEINSKPVKKSPGRPRVAERMIQDNFCLTPVIRDSLNAFSEKTGRPKALIVREALAKYLEVESV